MAIEIIDGRQVTPEQQLLLNNCTHLLQSMMDHNLPPHHMVSILLNSLLMVYIETEPHKRGPMRAAVEATLHQMREAMTPDERRTT